MQRVQTEREVNAVSKPELINRIVVKPTTTHIFLWLLKTFQKQPEEYKVVKAFLDNEKNECFIELKDCTENTLYMLRQLDSLFMKGVSFNIEVKEKENE